MQEWKTIQDLYGNRWAFNLPHEVYCKEVGKCSCSSEMLARMQDDPRQGVMIPKRRRHRICASLEVSPRGKSKPVHPAIELCPEVKSALKKGLIRIDTWRNPEPILPEPEQEDPKPETKSKGKGKAPKKKEQKKKTSSKKPKRKAAKK